MRKLREVLALISYGINTATGNAFNPVALLSPAGDYTPVAMR